MVDLIHDLKLINSLSGQFGVSEDYRNAVNNWRNLGEPPVPNHPKLLHYATRRKAHLYKLSMVAAVDKSNSLFLTKEDFNRAMGWLLQAEETMPDIFKAGAAAGDSLAMDELYHLVLIAGRSVSEHIIVNEARKRVPAHSVGRVIEIMERSGQIKAVSIDKATGLRQFVAVPR